MTVETTDNLGNEVGAHTLTAELGDVDELVRPVMIDGVEARIYAESLSRLLRREDDKSDLSALDRLLDDLYGVPHKASDTE